MIKKKIAIILQFQQFKLVVFIKKRFNNVSRYLVWLRSLKTDVTTQKYNIPKPNRLTKLQDSIKMDFNLCNVYDSLMCTMFTVYILF